MRPAVRKRGGPWDEGLQFGSCGGCTRHSSVRRQCLDHIDAHASERVEAGVETPRVAIADRKSDVAGIEAEQRRVETLPAAADPGLRPRLRHEDMLGT